MTDNLHYRACNLCEAICGLVITVKDGEVLSVKGDPDDPLSKGHICPKAVALKDVYADPDRLRTPVRRTANGWEAISWEEAFEAVATGLQRVQETHGKDAVGVYLGNPTVHNWGSMLFGPE
ncbi:MAG: molybdopterin-dependent oxidoreductase, partial [Saprospiraceae bacterium]|nr:molybdopterin-dependent oxidoreductase [Saprospiraceae bacterium]